MSFFRSLNGTRLPHKGFNFDGPAIMFELKFVRGRPGIIPRSVAAIRRDLSKMETLFRRLERDGVDGQMFCYFVVFSKVERRAAEFDQLVDQHRDNQRLKIMYASAQVTWPRGARRTPNPREAPSR